MIGFKKFRNVILESAYNVPITDGNDNTDLGKLVKYLQQISNDTLVMVSNSKGRVKIRRDFEDKKKDIEKFIKDNNLDIPFASAKFGNGSVGIGGKKISENTQELMVAALVLLKYKGESLNEQESIELIERAKQKFDSIIGSSGRKELLEQFDRNFNDLATAISSSNAILDIVPNPKKVYWTGSGWHKDIAKYNPSVGNIRDYNSSDIVVQGGDNVFYGFSLKKKASIKQADPTLINKPITGKSSLLRDIVGPNELKKIEAAKDLFFNYAIEKEFKGKYTRLEISKMTLRERNVLIKQIPTKTWSQMLRDPKNIFFRRVENVIKRNKENFVKEFLNLIFRTKLNEIIDAKEFKFFLLTGIGRFVNKELVIEKAETKDIETTINVIQDIFSSNIDVRATRGKKQAFETGSSAAKLYFTIFSDNDDIVDIEIRYKGDYTANPQFQAVATPKLKKIFKDVK